MSVENHVSDFLAAYALGCLEVEDAAKIAAHLPVCQACREGLQSYQQVVGQLARASPDLAPPPDLKDRLVSQVQARKSPAPPPAAESRRGRSPNWSGRWTPAWGFASLAVIVALAAGNLFLWQRMNRLEQRYADQLQVVSLQGTDVQAESAGLIVISRDGMHGTIIVDDLPALDPEHEYQLWLIRDGQRTSGCVFSVSEDGYGARYVESPDPLASYTSFGVTIEPKGGSPVPTGPKVLGGDL